MTQRRIVPTVMLVLALIPVPIRCLFYTGTIARLYSGSLTAQIDDDGDSMLDAAMIALCSIAFPYHDAFRTVYRIDDDGSLRLAPPRQDKFPCHTRI